jgi:hypothetical protein
MTWRIDLAYRLGAALSNAIATLGPGIFGTATPEKKKSE